MGGIDGGSDSMLTLTPQPRWLQTFSETFGRKAEDQETGRRASLLNSPSKANSKSATTVVGSHCCKYHEVFCRLLLGRIYPAVDQKVRRGQAGFRRGRGCIDQIFAPRNLWQCASWYPMEDKESLWNPCKNDHSDQAVIPSLWVQCHCDKGIQWIQLSQLEDLDLANDLAVLSTEHIH